MSFVAVNVRRAVAALVILAPLGISDAQVAFQVKSGSTWTSSITLTAITPLTFRWRWDGAETIVGVGWQVATIAPVSTATTRATDVIAGETPMRLPSAVKGGYHEFTVNPDERWPLTFYIRMRATVGRTSVFSRWIPVTVNQRTPVAANPTCTIAAIARGLNPSAFTDPTQPVLSKPIESGAKVSSLTFDSYILRVTFKNHLATPVSYRRTIWFALMGEKVVSYSTENTDEIHELAASKTGSFEMLLVLPSGTVSASASVRPLSGLRSDCAFKYEIIS